MIEKIKNFFIYLLILLLILNMILIAFELTLMPLWLAIFISPWYSLLYLITIPVGMVIICDMWGGDL